MTDVQCKYIMIYVLMYNCKVILNLRLWYYDSTTTISVKFALMVGFYHNRKYHKSKLWCSVVCVTLLYCQLCVSLHCRLELPCNCIHRILYKVLYIMVDLDSSFHQLTSFNASELSDLEVTQETWIENAKKELKCDDPELLTAELFLRLTKPVLSRWLGEARDIMCRQRQTMEEMKDIIGAMKTEALGDKARVIKLQEELLERKEEQLESLQSTVQATVQDSVKTEMRSYSGALQKPSISTAGSISPGAFKKEVKEAIEDEDRSKSIMVFGLAEEAGEQLDSKVSGIFLELEEKPRSTAVRVGKTPTSTTESGCRPVKVTLTNSAAVRQILMKAKLLRQVEKFRAVYLCPDRSREDRASRRQLVTEMKKKAEEQPGHQHFIRGGKVVSVVK